MKLKTTLSLMLAIVLTTGLTANDNEDLKAGFIIGNPEMSSIKAIAFGPDNILFVGDNTGMSLLAIDVKDSKRRSNTGLNMSGLNEKFAAAMGASKDDISIEDMAVNPLTKNVFFAVSKQSGEESHYALFKLGDDGLKEFSLEEVSHSKMAISNAPVATHKTWRRPSRTYTVTDLHYANGEVIVAGLSNEEFSSGLRRIPFPFNEKMITTSIQVYHVTHGSNETHAPIHRFLPVKLQNQWHVVAGYMCTPLVTFKMAELNGNKKLVGKTVAEIGAGNTPTGIISYNYKGEDYVLVGNNVHPLTKITGENLLNAKAISKPSRSRGVKKEDIRMGSIAHIADYDENNILLIVRNKSNDSYELKTVAKKDI